MPEVFEKILERLENLKNRNPFIYHKNDQSLEASVSRQTLDYAKEIVRGVADEYNNGWILCSERLPYKRDWYLAVFEEVDTGFIGLPYIADYLIGANTKYTTNDGWIIHNCTDREDESAEYYKKLRCVAWQPLPEPYREEKQKGGDAEQKEKESFNAGYNQAIDDFAKDAKKMADRWFGNSCIYVPDIKEIAENLKKV